MLNDWIYQFAVWLDGTAWSSGLHESFYMYNWIESTHVVTLMLSLGMLFLIDLRLLGLTLTRMPAPVLAHRLNIPMWIGFSIMIVTGLLLFYAVPVRTSTSVWFRIKFVLLFAAAINAWILHRRMASSGDTWGSDSKAPRNIRIGAALSLGLWAGIVTTGRLIAYDWYDCYREQSEFINFVAGCVANQTH